MNVWIDRYAWRAWEHRVRAGITARVHVRQWNRHRQRRAEQALRAMANRIIRAAGGDA